MGGNCLKNDFYQILSKENQQLVNKIQLFVAANTFLKVSHQQSFIKFSYDLNDSSVFYISKSNDDALYIKFREKPTNLKNFPGDKVFLYNAIEKVLVYIKDEFGLNEGKKLKQPPNPNQNKNKHEEQENLSKDLASKVSKVKSDKEIEKKFEEIFAFILESFEDLYHSEDFPILFWFEKEDIPILRIDKNPKDNSIYFNIEFLNPYSKKLPLHKQISINSEVDTQNLIQILFDHIENNHKIMNLGLASNGDTGINNNDSYDPNEDFSDLENTDLLINKKILKPRKIYLSSKFKKSIASENVETVNRVYQILEEVENGPIGREFLKFIKSYKINKIYDFYKIRVNDVKRIVFQYFHYQGYSGMKIVDFISDHKFDYLREINLEKMTFTLWTSGKNEWATKIPFLNSLQQQIVINKDYPSIVFGAAGSGKTSISLEKYLFIHNYLTEQSKNISKSDLIYLTFNPKMAIDIGNQIRLFFTNPFVMTVDELFIELLGYSNLRIQNYEDFETWFDNNYSKAFDQKNKAIASTIDTSSPAILAYTYYRGVFKGSLGLDFEKVWSEKHLSKDVFTEYLVSENLNMETINALWSVFVEYERYISLKNLKHDNDLAFEVLNKLHLIKERFESIIIDETQDLTQLQIFTLVKLSKDMRIYFYGDSNQTINPTIFSLGKLNQIIFKISNGVLKIDNPYILRKTYRASRGLVEYTNHLVDLRKKWIAYQGEEIDYHHEAFGEDGEIRWATRVHQKDLIEYIIEKTLNNPNSIILVPNHKIKKFLLELKDIKDTNQNRIYTIYEAKGLEWDSVILYKFVGSEISKFIEMDEGKGEKSTFHRMIFNKYYVACTRARRTTIIIEDKDNAERLESLFDSIHEVKDKSLVDNYFNNDISPEAWFKEAINLFAQFEYKKARLSYEKSIDYDSDRVFGLIEICNELEKATTEHSYELNKEIILKLKEKNEHDHLLNYYQQKGQRQNIKLMQMYKGEQLEKEEVLDILREVDLDSIDEELLMKSPFVNELFQKEEELKKEIRSVIK